MRTLSTVPIRSKSGSNRREGSIAFPIGKRKGNEGKENEEETVFKIDGSDSTDRRLDREGRERERQGRVGRSRFERTSWKRLDPRFGFGEDPCSRAPHVSPRVETYVVLSALKSTHVVAPCVLSTDRTPWKIVPKDGSQEVQARGKLVLSFFRRSDRFGA